MRRQLILVLFALAAAGDAHAQEWVFRAEVGLIGHPEAFTSIAWSIPNEGPTHGSGTDCRVNVVEHVGLGVGRRVNRWLHIDGVASLQASPGSGCDSAAIPLNNVVMGYYLGRTVGDDYFSTELRAVVEPGRSNVRARAVLGVGWVPKKRVPSVAVGAGFSAGQHRARFVSELAAQFSRVEWSRQFTCYGNCGPRTGMQWIESGTHVVFQPYARIGVEF